MPRKVRDYKAEYANDSPERRKQRAMRNKARRIMERENGSADIPAKTDVDHIEPLSKGGATGRANLRLRSAHANRSYRRTKSGAIADKKK